MKLEEDINVEHMTPTFVVYVCSHVYGMEDKPYNIMYHGWLFPDQRNTNDGRGIFVNVPDSFGFDENPDFLSEKMSVIEQHIHTVERDEYVHFGPDVGKFKVSNSQFFSGGYFWAFDLNKSRCLVEVFFFPFFLFFLFFSVFVSNNHTKIKLVILCPPHLEENVNEDFFQSNLIPILQQHDWELSEALPELTQLLS